MTALGFFRYLSCRENSPEVLLVDRNSSFIVSVSLTVEKFVEKAWNIDERQGNPISSSSSCLGHRLQLRARLRVCHV